MSISSLVRYYSVANRILAFQGNDEPVLNLVHNFLSGYYFTPAELTKLNQAPAHLIEIHQTGVPPSPSAKSRFPIEDGYCYPEADQLILEVNGSTILVGSPQLNRTDVWLSEGTAKQHPLALNNVILYAVQAALRRAGLYQFHSGCVLPADNDQGVLIVGDSGSGKSTLTVTLLNQGWRFVSDDNLLLQASPAGIVAWALRQYFTFDQSTLAACDLLRFEESVGSRVPSDPAKLRFYARRAFPDSFVEACLPDVILFPALTDETQSQVKQINQADALVRLLRQCPWATCDTAAAPAHLEILAKLTRQTRSYTFAAGKDVFADPVSISGLIRELSKSNS